MALYSISDLHLSFSCDKPMNVFRGWEDHTLRIENNWNRLVTENDTVVLPGDLSWGLKPEQAIEDLKFIDSLSGKKIIGKGNHDLWWGTKSKVEKLLIDNGLDTIKVLFNNAYRVGDIAVCGTRGWFYDSPETEKKVVLREAGRLKMSIEQALALGGEPIVFLHYPPVYGNEICDEIMQVLTDFSIKRVYHGHIHGLGMNKSVKEYGGITFKLVSCDCVDFTPIFITR